VIFLLHCFQHTIETDRRDDPVDPYKGYYTRVVQEFAGLGGDTVFGKAEIHSALYHQIWNDLVNMQYMLSCTLDAVCLNYVS